MGTFLTTLRHRLQQPAAPRVYRQVAAPDEMPRPRVVYGRQVPLPATTPVPAEFAALIRDAATVQEPGPSRARDPALMKTLISLLNKDSLVVDQEETRTAVLRSLCAAPDARPRFAHDGLDEPASTGPRRLLDTVALAAVIDAVLAWRPPPPGWEPGRAPFQSDFIGVVSKFAGRIRETMDRSLDPHGELAGPRAVETLLALMDRAVAVNPYLGGVVRTRALRSIIGTDAPTPDPDFARITEVVDAILAWRGEEQEL